MTVAAAKDKGFITSEQIEVIVTAAAETMEVKAKGGADTDAECQEAVAKLKQATAGSE